MAYAAEEVKQVAADFVAHVKSVFPIDKAYLYGSYAKGSQTEHSDIDICFFSHSFEGRKSVDVLYDLLVLSRKFPHFDIEPRAFPTSEIDNDNPFVKEVLRTGYEL